MIENRFVFENNKESFAKSVFIENYLRVRVTNYNPLL